MNEVYVVNILNYIKGKIDGKEVIVTTQGNVIRVFASPKDAKKYIEDYFEESATPNATLNSTETKKDGNYQATLTLTDSFIGGDSEQRMSDGSILSGCVNYNLIKVYPMDFTPEGTECNLEDDKYDIVSGDWVNLY